MDVAGLASRGQLGRSGTCAVAWVACGQRQAWLVGLAAKRAEDLQLRKEIENLQGENERLRLRVNRLKSDPDAIQHEARETLHYAKPNEVIVKLPLEPTAQTQPAGAGK